MRRQRKLALAVLIALSAAALSGSCTAFADEVVPNSYVNAALLSGGIALAITLLFFLSLATWRRTQIVAAICAASYLAAGFGAWFLLLWPLLATLVVAIGGGLFAHRITHPPSASAPTVSKTWVISSLAIVVAASAVVVGFWANYDPNFGDLFGGGGGPSTLNVLPFALIAGIVPPVIAIAAALMSAEPSPLRPGFTPQLDPPPREPQRGEASSDTNPQPSGRTVAVALSSVGLSVMIAEAADLGPAFIPILIPGAAVGAGVSIIIGFLFVAIARDRREALFFAAIGVPAFILAEFGIVGPLHGDWWAAVPALAVVAFSGRFAIHTACNAFGVIPRQARRPVGTWLVSVVAVALVVVMIKAAPALPLPSVVVPVALVAICAHLCSQACRRMV